MSVKISDIKWIQAQYPGSNPSATGTDACPSHEELWAAAEGSLPRHQWRTVFEHTLECELCAEGWRLARHLDARPKVSVLKQYVREIQSDLEAVTERAAAFLRMLEKRVVAPARGIAPHQWALAALVLVAVGLTPTILDNYLPAGGNPAVREELVRGGVIQSSLLENELLPRNRFVLKWKGGPIDARYQVEVTTEDLRLVARASGLVSPEFQVPAEALRDIASGETLLWQVTPLPLDTRNSHFETFRARIE